MHTEQASLLEKVEEQIAWLEATLKGPAFTLECRQVYMNVADGTFGEGGEVGRMFGTWLGSDAASEYRLSSTQCNQRVKGTHLQLLCIPNKASTNEQ